MPDRGEVLPLSLEHSTVGDAMHKGIVSCSPDTSAVKLARKMAQHHVHCVFVSHPSQDESGESYVWGIVSDLDLMRAVLRDGASERADVLASEPMVTVKPGMPLKDAAGLMVKNHVSHLVVVDPQTLRPVGVLSSTDIADAFAWGER